MSKNNVRKIECNTFPLPYRKEYSYSLFGHSVEALIDISFDGYLVVAGYASDYGAITLYTADAEHGRFRHGILSSHWVTQSEILTHDHGQLREWLAQAIKYCDDGNEKAPERITGDGIERVAEVQA